MKINRSKILSETKYCVAEYFINDNKIASYLEKNDTIGFIDNFYKRNRLSQKLLTFWYSLRSFFSRSFLSIGQQKDLYIILRYELLLKKIQEDYDNNAALTIHLSEGLKTLFADCRHSSVTYDNHKDTISVKGTLLKDILQNYDACLSSNSISEYLRNKLKQIYYYCRYPMDTCTRLKDSYVFIETVIKNENVTIDEEFFKQFLLNYAIICQALLASHATYSKNFFKILYERLENFSSNDEPETKQEENEDSDRLDDENTSLLQNIRSFSSVDNKASKKNSQKSNILEIKNTFEEEMTKLHNAVIELGKNKDKNKQSHVIKKMKKIFLKYHPDKNINEGKDFSSLYNELFQLASKYYSWLLEYFDSENMTLVSLDAILYRNEKILFVKNGFYEEVNNIFRDLENLRNSLDKIEKKIDERAKKLAKKQEEQAKREKEQARKGKELAEIRIELAEIETLRAEIEEQGIQMEKQITEILTKQAELKKQEDEMTVQQDKIAKQKKNTVLDSDSDFFDSPSRINLIKESNDLKKKAIDIEKKKAEIVEKKAELKKQVDKMEEKENMVALKVSNINSKLPPPIYSIKRLVLQK